MIINNTSVQGMFKYSGAAAYERGDFILFEGCIYVCTAKNPTDREKYTVSGRSPIEDPDNFSIYPGERISSASEYFSYVNGGGQVPDKYLSTNSLRTILQAYTFGITETGLSLEGVTETGDFTDGLRVINNPGGNKIDGILRIPRMNSGIFRISKELQEVRDIFGSNLETEEGDPGFVVLRQYTFGNNGQGTPQRTRIQEITDPVDGCSYIRFVQGSSTGGNRDEITGDEIWEYEVSESNSDWKLVFLSGEPKSKLESIRRYYTQRIHDLEATVSGKTSNFHNKVLESYRTGETEVMFSSDSDTVVINLSNSTGSGGREIVNTVSVPVYIHDLGSEPLSISITGDTYMNVSLTEPGSVRVSVINSGSGVYKIKEIISRNYR